MKLEHDLISTGRQGKAYIQTDNQISLHPLNLFFDLQKYEIITIQHQISI